MRLVVLRAGARLARRLLLLTGCLIPGALGLGAVVAHAAAPSSLAGEAFTSQEVKGSTVTGTCAGNDAGTVNFTVTGIATGPFPGAFTESGSFTTTRGGFPTRFSSTFTITAPAGTVTGTGSLATTNLNAARCFTVGTSTDVDISGLAITYSATINGAQRNTGTGTISMLGVLGLQLISFSQSFASNSAVQKQCQDGGWQSFSPQFKNQGDCVSFFATGGKNSPGAP